jgi:hypothetical protein
MNVILLVFVLTAVGEPSTMAASFESMADCERGRTIAMQILTDKDNPLTQQAQYAAAVCVQPVKVDAV